MIKKLREENAKLREEAARYKAALEHLEINSDGKTKRKARVDDSM